ncbi:hypothetical protein RSAG8_13764, partial [Rhizoctonia solani AG-8 WAC10335]
MLKSLVFGCSPCEIGWNHFTQNAPDKADTYNQVPLIITRGIWTPSLLYFDASRRLCHKYPWLIGISMGCVLLSSTLFTMIAANAALLLLFLAYRVSATPSLTLDVLAPKSVTDNDDLNLQVTLTNTGNVPLKLLNDPNSILSKSKADTFSISSKSCVPKFTGLRVNYNPSQAAKSTNPSAFTVLVPGQTVKFKRNLAGTYDFTQCGLGTYTFSASNIFNYVDESGESKTIKASTNPAQFEIAGKFSAPSTSTSTRHNAVSKRDISFDGCNDDQKKQIKQAVVRSNALISNALSYLARINPEEPGLLYITWFGEFNTLYYNNAMSQFKKIRVKATSITYDCTACLAQPGVDYSTTSAYINVEVPGKIYLCGKFWEAPINGAGTKSGIIVHELSHFPQDEEILGTNDYVYGRKAAQDFAISQPQFAPLNADNIQFFAENV